MILNLKFVNPIINQLDDLKLVYPEIDYFSFKHIKDYDNGDTDLINILNDLLKTLDCTIEYSYGRICMTSYILYTTNLSHYYFYLTRISNQILYNQYIDKVIQRHIDNLIFEYEHPYTPPDNRKKSKSKKTKLPPNKFIKRVTHDMFSGKETYLYYNPRTKEELYDDNPDLLDKLNAPKKKERKKSIKVRETGVPISAMTFSFKKK